MPTYKGTATGEVDYKVNADNEEQAKEFILEAFKDEYESDMFDRTFLFSVKEVK